MLYANEERNVQLQSILQSTSKAASQPASKCVDVAVQRQQLYTLQIELGLYCFDSIKKHRHFPGRKVLFFVPFRFL